MIINEKHLFHSAI
jgi:PleD family two-component response regulator